MTDGNIISKINSDRFSYNKNIPIPWNGLQESEKILMTWKDKDTRIRNAGQSSETNILTPREKALASSPSYCFGKSITTFTSKRINIQLKHSDQYLGQIDIPYQSIREIKGSTVVSITCNSSQEECQISWDFFMNRTHLRATFIWWFTFANSVAKAKSIAEGDVIADKMTSLRMTKFEVPDDFAERYEEQLGKSRKGLSNLGFNCSRLPFEPPQVNKQVLRCKLKELGLPQTIQSDQDNSLKSKTGIDNEKTHGARSNGLINGATGFLAGVPPFALGLSQGISTENIDNAKRTDNNFDGLIDNSEKITRIYNSSDHINFTAEASKYITTLTSAGVSPTRADTIMRIASFCIKNKIKLGSTPYYSYWGGSKQPIAFSPEHNIVLFSKDINTTNVPTLQKCFKVISTHYSFTDADTNKIDISPQSKTTHQGDLIDKQSANLITQSDNPIQDLIIFSPSLASIPSGISTINEGIEGVVSCLANRADGIQSFFGKQELSKEGEKGIYIRDEILHITPFDEKLWCQMFREAGRYKIADLYDQRQENAHKRGEKFKKFGILAGIFTANPLVPFMAYGQGVSGAPKGSKLEELIPDPQIEFLKDTNSYTSMTNMGGVIGKRRRIIMHKMEGSSGYYYRLIPAIVTHEHIIPCQVFDFEGQNFLRPIAAGINRNQENYDAAKIHRRYYHLRNEGKSQDTNERVKVFGDDIEEQQLRVFSFSSDITNFEYLYIEYATLPNHVF